jgi:adenylate kinase family enzyme
VPQLARAPKPDRVALRGPLDQLPSTTRRILITGASGAGNSTLRETISDALGYPTVKIDSLYHGPGWSLRPSFVAEVGQFTSRPNWVIEWQYSQVRELLLSRADTLIWDHSRWTVIQRVVRRTVRRRIRRIELWNGNHEPPLHDLHRLRSHHPLVVEHPPQATTRSSGSGRARQPNRHPPQRSSPARRVGTGPTPDVVKEPSKLRQRMSEARMRATARAISAVDLRNDINSCDDGSCTATA